MANTATYTTEVAWKGEHLGDLVMGDGRRWLSPRRPTRTATPVC